MLRGNPGHRPAPAGDLHPFLEPGRAWSGGRPAPGAEGTGPERERPATDQRTTQA